MLTVSLNSTLYLTYMEPIKLKLIIPPSRLSVELFSLPGLTLVAIPRNASVKLVPNPQLKFLELLLKVSVEQN